MLDRFATGDVSMATIDSWQLLHTTADRDPEALAEALQMAAVINASAFTSLAPRAGFGMAVVGLDHRCHYADSRFRDWFGNPGDSPALRRLAHQAARQGHFMPPSLMASQFATLEDPTEEADAVTVSVQASPAQVVEAALTQLAFAGMIASPKAGP